jgi:GTP cyclohydrolase I
MGGKIMVEQNIRDLLTSIGEDVNREGLIETPKRVARMYNEIFAGYKEDPKRHLFKSFDADFDEEVPYEQGMVIVKDIDFYSHCEHHMVPFMGKVHIGYIPTGRVAGLSKFARLVEGYAHRLQIQERLTKQIAEAIDEVLKPQGVIVVIEAQHMCMKLRGVKNATSSTVTSAVRGAFSNSETRAEFMALIK